MRNSPHRPIALMLFLAILVCGFAPRIAHAETQDEAAIRTVLNTQVAAWNRGDVAAFMQGYNNSPATTFVGRKTVEHGYAAILARYRKTYADKDKMGQLTFDNIDIHPLDASFAVATGRFHIARNDNDGGNAEGIFSLIFQKTGSGWKIILDHTS